MYRSRPCIPPVRVIAARRAARGALLLSLLLLAACPLAFAQGRPDLVWMRGNHANPLRALTVSPDGKYLATGTTDGYPAAYLWRVKDGMVLRTFPHGGGITALAFSPDGSVLAAADSSGAIALRRIPDGQLLRTLNAPGGSPWSVSYSPDGAVLAVGSNDGAVRLWRTADGMLLRTIPAHQGAAYSVAFSRDGSLLASGSGQIPGANDPTVKLWRVADGEKQTEWIGPQANPSVLWAAQVRYRLAFTSDGTRLVIGAPASGESMDSVLHMRRLSDGALINAYHPGRFPHLDDFALSPSGDDVVLTLSSCGPIACGTWAESHRLSDNRLNWSSAKISDGGVLYPSFLPDGQRVAMGKSYTSDGSEHGAIELRRASDGTVVGSLTPPGASGSEFSVKASPDGKTIATAAFPHGTLLLRRPEDGSVLHTLLADQAWTFAYIGDGSQIVVGRSFTDIRLYRVSDGGLVWAVPNAFQIDSLAASPDGQWIADSNGRILRASDGGLVHSLGSGGHVAFSPDGRYLAVGTNLYRTSDWSFVRGLGPLSFAFLHAVAFSPDSKTLALAGGSTNSRFGGDFGVDLFDVSSGALQRHVPAFTDVTSIAFSPEGQVLAVKTADAVLRFWRLFDGQPQTFYDQETGPSGAQSRSTGSVTYAPDGKFLFYGRSDGVLCATLNPYRNAVFPNRGGNKGDATVRIVTPSNFGVLSGAQVRLTAKGQPDIVGRDTTILGDRVLSTTFDLRGKALGDRDIVIVLPDGSTLTHPGGFTIEEGIATPQLVIDILARNQIRVGQGQTYQVQFGNRGNVDVDRPVLWITFPKYMTWKLVGAPGAVTATEVDTDTLLVYSESSFAALDTKAIILKLTAPNDLRFIRQKFEVRAGVNLR